MGLCPLFHCSFCLQGMGPFGGPCVPWEAELWSPLRLGSMGKHPRSTCITWSMAEVLGLVWLSLKGVCVLCFSALSACKGWGHLVAPVCALGDSFLTLLKPPGSLFGAFWHHFGSLGLPVATFQAILAPYGESLLPNGKINIENKNHKKCMKHVRKLAPEWEPFWVPFGRLGHPWAP